VLDVTVIGLPHAKWGESANACAIARGAVGGEAIGDQANARLAKPQRLTGAALRCDFPRNALGEVIKRLPREAATGCG
jgi:hypothetical protein